MYLCSHVVVYFCSCVAMQPHTTAHKNKTLDGGHGDIHGHEDEDKDECCVHGARTYIYAIPKPTKSFIYRKSAGKEEQRKKKRED